MHAERKIWIRKSLQSLFAVVLLFTGISLLAPPALCAEDAFVFVSLPDTQVYAENRFPGDGLFPAVTDARGTYEIFLDQTQWIVDNASTLGIRYVGHLGDIVQNGSNLDEWARAQAAMNLLLEADLPHGTVMGNHDDNQGSNYMQNYLDHFGPKEFEGKPWYAASSPGGGGNFQLLEHKGRKIGFLNFSIDHPQSELDWAHQLIELHPDVMFIVGAHRYLFDIKLAGGRYGETLDSPFGPLVIQDSFEDGVVDPNTAEALFNELVSQHPNIVMIHAGHFHSEWLRLDGQNSAQQTVIQILTDYQSTRNGGDGWLRIYKMDFDNNKFEFETYSPTLDRYRTTIDHFVETIHIAYAQRAAFAEALGITEKQYLALLETLKDTPAPDDFLYQHPDFDEGQEQAYYQQYLSDLFLGEIPSGFEDIAAWEGLWLQAFAYNPLNPLDFRDWVRSPSGVMDVDYAAYIDSDDDENQITAEISSPDANRTITAGQSISFQCDVVGGEAPFTYTWDFNGAADNSTQKNPGGVTFDDPGIYNIKLIVADASGGNSSDTVTVTVNEKPAEGEEDESDSFCFVGSLR